MRLKPIGLESPGFREIWAVYLSSFPPDERRRLTKQRGVFKDKGYSLLAAYDKGQLVGFISVWDFDDFVFVEHFAVKGKFRCKGHGTEILNIYKEMSGKPVILEVERPHTGIAKRRIGFYGRLGFKVNSFDYSHPPYGKGKKWGFFYLMSYPRDLTDADYEKIKRTVHCRVYKNHGNCITQQGKCLVVQPAG